MLHELINDVTTTFANEYHNGDCRLAAESLLEKQGVDVDWNQFRKGIVLGTTLTLFVWLLWDIFVDQALRPNVAGARLWQEPLFRVFRAVFSFILLQWCWGVVSYVWTRSRVNFIYLLDFNPVRMFSLPGSSCLSTATEDNCVAASDILCCVAQHECVLRFVNVVVQSDAWRLSCMVSRLSCVQCRRLCDISTVH